MLEKNKIRILTNQFVKMASRVNFRDLEGETLSLYRVDGGWVLCGCQEVAKVGSIGAFCPDDGKNDDFSLDDLELGIPKKKFVIPEFVGEDEMDDLIDLAQVIRENLIAYSDSVKRNAGRSPEDRKAIAKKAIEARWAKYRAEKAKENGKKD